MIMMPVAKLLFVIFCHSKVKPGGRGGLASSDSGQSWTFPWGFTRVFVSHSIRITAKPQNQRQDEGNRDEHELEVVLQPGELLLYESARLPHGRTSFLRWLLSSFFNPIVLTIIPCLLFCSGTRPRPLQNNIGLIQPLRLIHLREKTCNTLLDVLT